MYSQSNPKPSQRFLRPGIPQPLGNRQANSVDAKRRLSTYADIRLINYVLLQHDSLRIPTARISEMISVATDIEPDLVRQNAAYPVGWVLVGCVSDGAANCS